MAYTPRAEPDNSDLEKEKELYASLYPPAGIAVNPNTGEALRPEQQGLLDQQAEEAEAEEESSLPSPVAMGLLGAGASMLRQSGWRDTPITLGEQIGYAIPAGMQAYYNQTIMNQEEEDRLAGEQKAQVDAEDALENEQAFLLALNTSKLKIGQKEHLFGLYKHNPTKAYELLKELTMPSEEKEGGKLKEVLNKKTNKMEWAWVYPNTPPEFIGAETGKESGLQTAEKEEFRWQAEHGLNQNRFGLSQQQFEVQKSQWQQSFNYQQGEDDANRAERIRMNDHRILQDGIRNGFTVKQIENQVQQYREMAMRRGIEFDQTLDLKKQILNFRKESWKTDYEARMKSDTLNHEQRVKEFEHKIAQDGIQNGFSAERIANDIKQFEDTLNLKKKHFTETHELKEKIFDWRVDDSIKKFNLQKGQFTERLTFDKYKYHKDHKHKISESARKQQNADRNYNQGVIEHLALIKQRGIKNGFDETRIRQAQEKFLFSQSKFDKEFSHKQYIDQANIDHRAATLAQQLAEYEYKKRRDVQGDIKDQDKWEKELREEQARIVQQAWENDFKGKKFGLDKDKFELSKAVFAADVEHKRLKLATEGSQPPQVLTGDAARDWAAENPNFELPAGKAGVPVIRINKHGNFDSVEWLSENKYNESQLSTLSRIQEKWMDSPDIRGSRKIARLARSLKALTDNKTGVSEFAMVYKFMKSLDETSTVLASEFRNAREAGLSAFDALELWGDKQFTGKQLDDDQKLEIVESVRTVAYQRLKQINQLQDAMIEKAVLGGISEEDARKMLPNTLAEYFKVYPYTGSTGVSDTTGAPTSGLEQMANEQYQGETEDEEVPE